MRSGESRSVLLVQVLLVQVLLHPHSTSPSPPVLLHDVVTRRIVDRAVSPPGGKFLEMWWAGLERRAQGGMRGVAQRVRGERGSGGEMRGRGGNHGRVHEGHLRGEGKEEVGMQIRLGVRVRGRREGERERVTSSMVPVSLERVVRGVRATGPQVNVRVVTASGGWRGGRDGRGTGGVVCRTGDPQLLGLELEGDRAER